MKKQRRLWEHSVEDVLWHGKDRVYQERLLSEGNSWPESWRMHRNLAGEQ